MYFSRHAASVTLLVRGESLRSVDVALPDPAARARSPNIEVRTCTEVVEAQRRRPPRAADAARHAAASERRPSTRAGCSSSSAPRPAPTGSTASSCATTAGSSCTGPGPAGRRASRPPAGRWTASPYHLETERPGRVRRRRRPGRVGEAGGVRRRRGRHGRDARAPLPGAAVNGQRRPRAELRDAVPVRGPRRRAAGVAGRARRDRRASRRATTSSTRATRPTASTCCSGHAGDEPPGRRRRRRDRPHRPARGLRRRDAGLPRRPGRPDLRATVRRDQPTRRSSCCRRETSRPRSASGSRWRCTCWRACSSACATPTPLIGQRERLLALGTLSAGLTHELNNPAAAAVRATVALRDRVAGMRHKLGMIAAGQARPRRSCDALIELQEDAAERVAHGAAS